MRKLEANGVTWEGVRSPEPDLSRGELKTYYPFCPSSNICYLWLSLGVILPENRTFVNVWR